MAFGRVGSIAKVTLKGLPAGATVKQGTFIAGENDMLAYMVRYKPDEDMTAIELVKGANQIGFAPEGVTANSDGEAVIWLRTLACTLSEQFSFEVTVEVSGEEQNYAKEVDLGKLGRTVAFKQGEMTAFSVALNRKYDVSINMSSVVTETTASLTFDYNLGGAPYTTIEYGGIFMTEYNPSVTVETAEPSSLKTYVLKDGVPALELTGLEPSTTYYLRSYALLDGVAYYDSYGINTFTTLTHYDYPAPTAVDLGLPSGTKWASFNLGSADPEAGGYFFAWGETSPRTSGTYNNKYWYGVGSFYTDGRARKYSYNARMGADDLIDYKSVLEAGDDAATSTLGAGWRTPSKADFKELGMYTTSTLLERDGNPYAVQYTSTVNSNMIVLPLCGYWGTDRLYTSTTYYMTSDMLIEDDGDCNNGLWAVEPISGAGGFNITGSVAYRCYLFNIRPVYGGTVPSEPTPKATVNTDDLEKTSTSLTFGGVFPPEQGNPYVYHYHVDIFDSKGTNSTPTYSYMLSTRTEKHEFTGLESGKTYYLRVRWFEYASELLDLNDSAYSPVIAVTLP